MNTADRLAQLAAENQKLRAALYQIEFPSCLVCFRRYPVGHASDCAIGQVLATTSVPAVVPIGPSTPNSSLPPLGDGPRRKMLVEIEVTEDFEKRLDNQWMVEREIHADRWSWKWANEADTALCNRISQLENALQLILPMAKGYAAEHQVGNNDRMVDVAQRTLLEVPPAPAVVPREDAEALVIALDDIKLWCEASACVECGKTKMRDTDCYDYCTKALVTYRAKHPLSKT